MPKLKPNSVPSYRLHKLSGQAIVTLSGRDIYLGAHGTPESVERYNRAVGEWQANGRRLKQDPKSALVASLIPAYWKFASGYYPGGMRGELASIKLALAHVRRLYETLPVADFGPLCLKAVRDAMVAAGWSGHYVNAQVGRVKRMFRWGVENELAPPSVYEGLRAVQGLLLAGRTPARRETSPVKPVAEDRAAAIYPHVADQVKDMIRLQLVSGMRPGEACKMRTCEIERADPSGRPPEAGGEGGNWVYRPAAHKTLHHGHTREIYLGPRAQDILRSYLKTDPQQAFLFSPAEAEAAR